MSRCYNMDTYYIDKEPDTTWLLTKTTGGGNTPMGVVKNVDRAVALIRYEYHYTAYAKDMEISVTRHQEIKNATMVYLPENKMKVTGYDKNVEWYDIRVDRVGLAAGEHYKLTKVPSL